MPSATAGVSSTKPSPSNLPSTGCLSGCLSSGQADGSRSLNIKNLPKEKKPRWISSGATFQRFCLLTQSETASKNSVRDGMSSASALESVTYCGKSSAKSVFSFAASDKFGIRSSPAYSSWNDSFAPPLLSSTGTSNKGALRSLSVASASYQCKKPSAKNKTLTPCS